MAILSSIGALGGQAFNAGNLYGTLHLIDQPFYEGLARANKSLAIASVQMEKSFNRASHTADTLANSLFTISTIAAVGVGGAVYAYAEFEKQMRNVNSITKLSEDSLRKLNKEVLDLTKSIGQYSPAEMAKGLYQIASSGFYGAEGMKVLKASAVAASAGIADLTTSTKAIVGVMNAYNMSANDAKRVSDILFQTVNYGVVEFQELSQYIGDVTNTAANLKVPVEQVGAALAAMTKAGIQAPEAVTALNRVLLAFLKPSKEMQKELKGIGYESGAAYMQANGLAGAFKMLEQHSRDDADSLAGLFGEVRGLKGAMTLAANEGKLFKEAMQEVADPMKYAGAATKAYEEQQKSLIFQFNKMKEAVLVSAGNFGKKFVPEVISAVKWVEKFSGHLDKLNASTVKNVLAFSLITAAALKLRSVGGAAISGFLNLQMKLNALYLNKRYGANTVPFHANVGQQQLEAKIMAEMLVAEQTRFKTQLALNAARDTGNASMQNALRIEQQQLVVEKQQLLNKMKLLTQYQSEMKLFGANVGSRASGKTNAQIAVELGAANASNKAIKEKIALLQLETAQRITNMHSMERQSQAQMGLVGTGQAETNVAREKIISQMAENNANLMLKNSIYLRRQEIYDLIAAQVAELEAEGLLSSAVGVEATRQLAAAAAARNRALAEREAAVAAVTATVATGGLAGALKALVAFLGGPLGIAFLALTALTIGITYAVNKHREAEEKRKEALQRTKDKLQAQKEAHRGLVSEMSSLYGQYIRLSTIEKKTASDKEQLGKTVDDLRTKVYKLTGKTDAYTMSLQQLNAEIEKNIRLQATQDARDTYMEPLTQVRTNEQRLKGAMLGFTARTEFGKFNPDAVMSNSEIAEVQATMNNILRPEDTSKIMSAWMATGGSKSIYDVTAEQTSSTIANKIKRKFGEKLKTERTAESNIVGSITTAGDKAMKGLVTDNTSAGGVTPYGLGGDTTITKETPKTATDLLADKLELFESERDEFFSKPRSMKELAAWTKRWSQLTQWASVKADKLVKGEIIDEVRSTNAKGETKVTITRYGEHDSIVKRLRNFVENYRDFKNENTDPFKASQYKMDNKMQALREKETLSDPNDPEIQLALKEEARKLAVENNTLALDQLHATYKKYGNPGDISTIGGVTGPNSSFESYRKNIEPSQSQYHKTVTDLTQADRAVEAAKKAVVKDKADKLKTRLENIMSDYNISKNGMATLTALQSLLPEVDGLVSDPELHDSVLRAINSDIERVTDDIGTQSVEKYKTDYDDALLDLTRKATAEKNKDLTTKTWDATSLKYDELKLGVMGNTKGALQSALNKETNPETRKKIEKQLRDIADDEAQMNNSIIQTRASQARDTSKDANAEKSAMYTKLKEDLEYDKDTNKISGTVYDAKLEAILLEELSVFKSTSKEYKSAYKELLDIHKREFEKQVNRWKGVFTTVEEWGKPGGFSNFLKKQTQAAGSRGIDKLISGLSSSTIEEDTSEKGKMYKALFGTSLMKKGTTLGDTLFRNAGSPLNQVYKYLEKMKDKNAKTAGMIGGGAEFLSGMYGASQMEGDPTEAGMAGGLAGLGAGAGLASALGIATGPIGWAVMGISAIAGGLLGSNNAREEADRKAREQREAQLAELRRLNHNLQPVNDYFRSMSLNNLPLSGSVTANNINAFSQSYAVTSQRGVL